MTELICPNGHERLTITLIKCRECDVPLVDANDTIIASLEQQLTAMKTRAEQAERKIASWGPGVLNHPDFRGVVARAEQAERERDDYRSYTLKIEGECAEMQTQRDEARQLAAERGAALAKAMECISYVRAHCCPDGWNHDRPEEHYHALMVDIPDACDQVFADPTATAALAEWKAMRAVVEAAHAAHEQISGHEDADFCSVPIDVFYKLGNALATLNALRAETIGASA